jgi:putative heme transporter
MPNRPASVASPRRCGFPQRLSDIADAGARVRRDGIAVRVRPHQPSTPQGVGPGWDRDAARLAARATAGALAVVALGVAVWHLRSMVILLLLALTFAAAIRPGVEWLHRRRVPQPLAILSFFLLVGCLLVLFFWLAVPPALHQVSAALEQKTVGGAVRNSTGIRHDVLVWLDAHLSNLPSGPAVLHPVASYGHKATDAVVATFFTLAATWYWVSERDKMIDLLAALAPEGKRERARRTFLAIDDRLGSYTRLKFVMIFAIGAVLSAGFFLIGLPYWLLIGGFVSLVEIVPVIGPLIGAVLVVVVALPESLHLALLGLLVIFVVRTFQSYVVNPHVMGHSVGLSPLVTLVSVSAVGLLFGAFAVVLAIPATSAVATLIDVLVLDHEPPQRPRAHRNDPAPLEPT